MYSSNAKNSLHSCTAGCWWVIYGSVDTWDSQIRGNPARHLIIDITAADCLPKTSRRTPFCHNFTSTPIMTMTNWPCVCVDEAKAKFLLQEEENLCVGGVAGELWLAPINIGLNKPLGRIHRNNNVISNSVFLQLFVLSVSLAGKYPISSFDDKGFNYCFEPPASRADAKQENLSNFSFSAKWQQKLLSGQNFRTSLVPLVLSVLPLHLASRLLHLKQALMPNWWMHAASNCAPYVQTRDCH